MQGGGQKGRVFVCNQSWYQLEIDCYISKIFQVTSRYHKTKSYGRYTQDKEKGIKYTTIRKSSIHKGKEQRNYKTARKQLTK